MLTAFGRCHSHIAMDEIGAGHAYRIDVLARNEVTPVQMRSLDFRLTYPPNSQSFESNTDP
jgi:hypothetical protein